MDAARGGATGALTCWLIIIVTTPLELTRAVMESVTPVLTLLTVFVNGLVPPVVTPLTTACEVSTGTAAHVHGGRNAVGGDDTGRGDHARVLGGLAGLQHAQQLMAAQDQRTHGEAQAACAGGRIQHAGDRTRVLLLPGTK